MLPGQRTLRPGFFTRAELHDLGDARAKLAVARNFQAQQVYDDVTARRWDRHDTSTSASELMGAMQRCAARLTAARVELYRVSLTLVRKHVLVARLDPPVFLDHPSLPTRLRGDCRTWWERELSQVTSTTTANSVATAMCSLPSGHASPHVNFLSGDVRLGHEPELAHVPADLVHRQVSDVVDALDLNRPEHLITYQDTYDAWTALYAKPHDHTTCGICPREVW